MSATRGHDGSGGIDVATGRAHADEFAVLLGYASWEDLGPKASTTCGAEPITAPSRPADFFPDRRVSIRQPPLGLEPSAKSETR